MAKKRAKESACGVKCMDCRHAYLMQSRKENPVVARCERTGQREVANARRTCEFHEKTFKYVIHPMIYLK